jgi:hypothetical protein
VVSLLTYAVFLGLSAASVVSLFRAVPPGKTLAKTGRKPWACDLCMSFWTTILGALAAGALGLVPSAEQVGALPAFIICLWAVKQTKDFEFPLDEK